MDASESQAIIETFKKFAERQNATDDAISHVSKVHGDLITVHVRLIQMLMELCVELAPDRNAAIRALKGKIANFELTESQNHIIEPLLTRLPSVE